MCPVDTYRSEKPDDSEHVQWQSQRHETQLNRPVMRGTEPSGERLGDPDQRIDNRAQRMFSNI